MTIEITNMRNAYPAGKLANLAPSVDLKVGNAVSSAKTGRTLTVNPRLLEKMQSDPEREKEAKELIKGVESMMGIMESVTRAAGWTCVYKHNYIDENGKFHSTGQYRNDLMLNLSDKLREEGRKKTEERIEKSKEKAAKRKEELQKKLEERKSDKDIKAISEAATKDDEVILSTEGQADPGSNIDIQA